MSGLEGALQSLADQFGYPGVFVISVLGSAIPFIPLPYLLVVVLLSQSQDPLLLGLLAGAGGAIGKLTSYFLGRFGYLAAGSQTRENLDALRGISARYGALGVFVFSATPLPDDVYVIPMGIIRLPFWRFFLSNLAGKVVLSTSVAYLGRTYFTSLDSLIGDSLAVTASAVALTVALSLLIMRADWVTAIRIAKTQGIRGLIVNIRAVLRLGKSVKT